MTPAGLGDTVESILLALFPPRCAACDTPLAMRPPFLLCEPCFEVLEPNLGARCPQCDLPISGPGGTCSACRSRRPPFSRLRAPLVYGGGLAEMISAAKFRGREELAAAAGRLLAADEEACELLAGATALVPVPLGRKRRRQRGYNQAGVIARTVSRKTHCPVRHVLGRTRETTAQSDLPVTDRAANVDGAFTARRDISGRVALIDDVVTSGHTACEAAQALLDGGASDVVVLAVARAV